MASQVEGETSTVVTSNDSNEGRPTIDKKVYKFANNIWNELYSKAKHLIEIGNYENKRYLQCTVSLDPVEYELLKSATTWHFFEDKLMEGLNINWIKGGAWNIKAVYVFNKMIHNIFPKECYDKIQALFNPDNIKKDKIKKFIYGLKRHQDENKPQTRIYPSIGTEDFNKILKLKEEYGLHNLLGANIGLCNNYYIDWLIDEISYKKSRKDRLIKDLKGKKEEKRTITYIPDYAIEKYDIEIINDIIQNKKNYGLSKLKDVNRTENEITINWHYGNNCSIQ